MVPFGLGDFPVNNVCGQGSSICVSIIVDDYVLNISDGVLDPLDTCTFSVDLQLPDGTPGGDETNTTSEVTATIDGSARIGSPASDTLTVVNTPRFSKDFIDDPVEAGDTVTLEFTLTNVTAAVNATEIAFTDDLGSVLSGLVATGLPPIDICGPGSSLSGTSLLIFQN